jgi:hypothetical protein
VALGGNISHLVFQPIAFSFGQIGQRRFRTPFGITQQIEAGCGRNSRQPSFQGTTALEIRKPRVCAEEGFLRRVFDIVSSAEESAGDLENAGAVATNDLCEGRLVAFLRSIDQRQFRRLFQLILQIRSRSIRRRRARRAIFRRVIFK